jgi:LCP family protein required for cell wall assembly
MKHTHLPDSLDSSSSTIESPSGPAEPDPSPPPPGSDALVGNRRTRRPRLLRLGALILGLVVFVTGVGLGVGGLLYYRSIEGDIPRVDPFAEVPAAERPKPVAKKAINFLILGSDSHDRNRANSRADTIILAHLKEDRRKAQLISIPRDTWVYIPKGAGGRFGGANAKINAALAWGGTPLMVRTVERFTGVRLDHVVLIDFAGFKDIIDALGGVDVQVDTSFTSIARPFRQFTAGTQTMDGAAALDYARQRQQFPDGDFARIRHQQAVIKAVLAEATTGGLLTDPARLDAFLRAVAKAVTVDKALSILQMAAELRQLRAGDLAFLTSPSRGTGQVAGQSVVLPDRPRAAALYHAINRDQADTWFTRSQ